MIKVVWVVSLLCASLGACIGVAGIAGASGSPQQAAAAAIALAMAVIPYCFARACEQIAAPKLAVAEPAITYRCKSCHHPAVAGSTHCGSCGARFESAPTVPQKGIAYTPSEMEEFASAGKVSK